MYCTSLALYNDDSLLPPPPSPGSLLYFEICLYWSHIRNKMYARRTRSFSVTRMRSNNSARINKSDFTTEKIV